MAEARQNTIVGLFALVGIVVMAALVFMFGGGQTIFARTYDIKVHFPEGVMGVQEGQGVTLHGKRIGETEKVAFWIDGDTGEQRPEKGVIVTVAVDVEYDLPASSTVLVARSIMGFGRPAIQLVIENPFDPDRLSRDGTAMIAGDMIETLDQVLPPDMQETLYEATEDIGELASSLTPVALHLARLLEARDVQKVDLKELAANLDTVVQRFDMTLKNVNTVIGDEENQVNFKTVLANASKISESGIVFMEDMTQMSHDGTQVVKDVGILSKKLAFATDELSSVLQRTDQALLMMTEGKGTAGLLLTDNRLYEEMVLSTKRLTKTLDDVREVLDRAKKGASLVSLF